MTTFLSLLAYDLKAALRSPWDVVTVLLFFILAVTLLVLGAGPDPSALQKMAPGALWVGALLAALLSLPRVFQDDAEDGTLDAIMTGTLPLEAACFAKMLAHWLVTGLPLVAATPVAAAFLQAPPSRWMSLMAVMALGTPILSLIGGTLSALLVGARRGGVLIAILGLPLFAPVLIFAAGATSQILVSGDAHDALSLLAGMLVVTVPLAPLLAGLVLREE